MGNNRQIIQYRRRFLQSAGLGLLGLAGMSGKIRAAAMQTLPFGNGERELVVYPQKRSLLRITTRPPHLETPFEVFDESLLTPNDGFFVRYHLADLPLSIDPDRYRLTVSGHVDTPLSLSLNALKAMGRVEMVAVNQCAGNSRGYSSPRVFGAQLGNGSMGNARWAGIPLRSVLEKAGIRSGARLVAMNGLDRPVLPVTPDYVKTLEIEHAMSDEPLIAWEMNGQEIPFLNGYPLKLIVPGYFGTYWIKHLCEIHVLDQPLDGLDSFAMNRAYRVPDNECFCVLPGTVPDRTRPITRFRVRSFITSLHNGSRVKAGQKILLKGIAFDGGSGIRQVEISSDGGRNWEMASLGRDFGRFSFREWRLDFVPENQGDITLMVRATANSGETQPMTASWNPGGYLRNVVESVAITVA